MGKDDTKRALGPGAVADTDETETAPESKPGKSIKEDEK